MKNKSVLNVLMYLFKNHVQEHCALDLERKKLLVQLEELDFHRIVVNQALIWLNNLPYSVLELMQLPQKSSFRVFSDEECELLNIECRRFLLTLEQQSILNFHTRELVINQAIEFSAEDISVSVLKWVAIMVLLNQPDEKQALASMGLSVLNDA